MELEGPVAQMEKCNACKDNPRLGIFDFNPKVVAVNYDIYPVIIHIQCSEVFFYDCR